MSNKIIQLPAPVETTSTGTRVALVVASVVTITTTIAVTTISCMSPSIVILVANRNTQLFLYAKFIGTLVSTKIHWPEIF